MIVYGDRRSVWNVRQEIERIRGIVDPVTLLIEVGKLAQGVCDAGVDDATLHGILLASARGHIPIGLWNALGDLPSEVEVSEPEGYAFYGVHPALYVAAAKQLPRRKSWLVIGIRSIGTSLGAAVASALPNSQLMTVRPVGHPYDRVILEDIPKADAYAVVDEGPGLSGSSFAAVGARIDSPDVWYFPSHGGDPGPHAGEDRIRWWRSRRKAYVDFDSWFDPHTLAPGRVEDWCAGRWRERLFDPPPAYVQQERRKYYFPDANLVARFAGLGVRGAELLAKTRLLADHGFSPPPRALRNGFLLTEAVVDRPKSRERILDTIGRYIAFRTAQFPPTGGATPRELAQMAEANLGASNLDIPEEAFPVGTDNRMHRWEWLGLLKIDLDHNCSHDLIGCQDPAWDIAGACFEWRATPVEARKLITQVEQRTSRSWSPRVLRFYETCYRAFWAGYYTMALETCGADEAPRLRRAIERYRENRHP